MKTIDSRTNVCYNIIKVLSRRMAVSCLTGEVSGLLRKEVDMSVSEVFELVIMLCAIAKLFYTIGKDISKRKRNDKQN